MKNRYSLLFLVLAFVIASCGDDNGTTPDPDPVEETTVYVTNEGNFSDSNGSLTRYEPEDGTTLQSAFEDVNGRPMAGIIQSSRVVEDLMYIVLNATDKIEVVDAQTLESIGTIELSTTPSAIEVIDEGTAYVTNLYNEAVSIIDLDNMEDTGNKITVGDQPRSVVRVGGSAFVANNGGGNANTISVIDIDDQSVTRTIEVGNGPSQIVTDEENRLWVVCAGLLAYDENWERDPENDIPGGVYILDGNDGTIINSIETGGHPSGIALDENNAKAYLLNDGVSVIDMNTFAHEEGLIERSFNSIGYFGVDQQLFLGQSRGYDQQGQALIYNLEGTAVDSFPTGIAPNGFEFHQLIGGPALN